MFLYSIQALIEHLIVFGYLGPMAAKQRQAIAVVLLASPHIRRALEDLVIAECQETLEHA